MLLEGVRPLGRDPAGGRRRIGARPAGVAAGRGDRRGGGAARGGPVGAARDGHREPRRERGSRGDARHGPPPGLAAVAPIEVRAGQLHVVPLGRGQEAELTIEPGDGVSLGPARRSPRIPRRDRRTDRHRPRCPRPAIPLPKRSDDRRAVLASWRTR